jgi:hypothetical protein
LNLEFFSRAFSYGGCGLSGQNQIGCFIECHCQLMIVTSFPRCFFLLFYWNGFSDEL